MPNIIYVVNKGHAYGDNISYERTPIVACCDYQKILEYVENLCNNILTNGDSYFKEEFDEDTDDPEPLFMWKGLNYYQVGTNNMYIRIIFRIQEVPILEEEEP